MEMPTQWKLLRADAEKYGHSKSAEFLDFVKETFETVHVIYEHAKSEEKSEKPQVNGVIFAASLLLHKLKEYG